VVTVPWYSFLTGRPLEQPAALTAAAPAALTAAAAPAAAPRPQYIRHPDRWQNEVWTYYDTLGEFRYGVNWLANMMSRVRLRAGEMDLATDEPTLVNEGLPAEIMSRLGSGVGGKSEIMRRITVQLSVPGEGYVIGETVNGVENWQVRSVDEVRVNGGKYQVTSEDTVNTGAVWRDLAPDSVPLRVWRPHDRYYHRADSPARAALPVMRELELVNRHITAMYLSRISSAGLLIIPQEASFPVREEFADEDDPLSLEWVEIAAESIQSPGQASAVVPMLIRVAADVADKIRHLDFTLRIDDKILEKRDQAIRRLATIMDLPSDVMLGYSDLNHWNAFAMEESGLKVHVAPLAEQICDSITRGYFQPRLEASGGDPTKFVAWYDMSELEQRPDRSANAKDAYDRLELSGEAYRREGGFSEEDAPTTEELKDIGLKSLIHLAHGAAPSALDVLVGTQLVTPATVGPGAADSTKGVVPPPGEPAAPAQDEVPAPAQGPPSAPPATAPVSGPPSQAAADRRRLQTVSQHAVRFQLDGRWNLMHPGVCADHAYTCPFTHAVTTAAPVARPGSSGTHLARLDAFGRIVIDGPAPYLDTSAMVSTVVMPGRLPVGSGSNGLAHV
jgi:hypothetical protein